LSNRTHQIDGWFAVIAAIFVLFTAMLDARVSAVLGVVLLLAFAGYRFMQSRRA
jgi:hypothetical protein